MPDRRTVTIKDIAKKLGMSHSTVSRALNDHAHISADTKGLVQRTAQRLGYVPNSSARIMRGGPGSLIGLVVPDVQNDFYSTVAKLLAEKCTASGYQLVLAITEDDAAAEHGQLQALIEARAAGIVITPTAAPMARTLALLRYAPCVQLVRHLPEIKCDAVVIDDIAGTAAATRHLLALGHRRIAYIGGSDALSTGHARLQGYLKAIKENGIEPAREQIRLGMPRQTFGRQAVAALLAGRTAPTAFVLGSSGLTVGVFEALAAASTAAAEQYSIIGYGDPPWFPLMRPPLTTIGLPVAQLVEATAALLFDRIGDEAAGVVRGKSVQPARRMLQPHLIVRGSTRAPAAGARPSRPPATDRRVESDAAPAPFSLAPSRNAD